MKAVLQWVLRTMMKDQTGIVRTMPKKDLVDFNVAMTMERLMRNGFDPNAFKNANQVENAINQIEAPRNVQQGIKSTGKIFDMEGKEINPKSKIMGGKQAETDAEIKARLEKSNKEGIAKIKSRQKMLDDAIDDASPGFSGDRKVDAELVAENLAERMGKVYDDLPTKERLKIYDEAFQGLSKRRKMQRESLEDFVDDAGGVDPDDPRGIDDFIPDDDPEPLAQGGRAGFSEGSGGLLDLLDIQAEGSKTGKQQIPGAPEGITMDSETYNFIVNADIPIGEKINLLTKYGRGKGRTRIEKDDQELFLGEGGSRTREIGIDINPDAEKGFGGNIMYNPDSNQVKGGITYKFNEGGRAGFKDGMTRRTFLKILGGAMAIPIIGKFLKPLKTAKGVTKVPMIKTDNVPGKPEWFDQLVNKVIMEGDDVTKKFATGERQSIHQKTLDDGSVVRVTEDVDDGAVRVESESVDNMYEDPVQLQYKKPLPDEGDPRPTAEFTTAESGPVGRAFGPDDYEIEIDEVGGTSISDLTSDVSKLKEYATGKKPTLKEFVESKKRKDKAAAISEGGESEMDAVIRRQGEYEQFGDVDPNNPDNFAKGGLAGMLGE